MASHLCRAVIRSSKLASASVGRSFSSEVGQPSSKFPLISEHTAKWMQVGKSSGEIGEAQEPLINGTRGIPKDYSVAAAILPFLFPALGGLLYGYDIGATSCATLSIESATLSGISWYDLSSVEIGLVTSGSLYGALIGSVVAFNIADFLGRRRELILASVLYFVGALLEALAPDFAVLVVGRFVFGIGIGLVTIFAVSC